MKTIIALVASAVLGGTVFAAEPLRYDFESVRGKVTVATRGSEDLAKAGDAAGGGDRITTNWRGRAVVAVTERGSRFEIFPSSRVVLASEEPGVLVELERGRLKAWFDKLTGTPDERFVKTPGAILAVRGTRYGIEVDSRGMTRLEVFEGVVEVQQLGVGAGAAFLVSAGQMCELEHGAVPRLGPMQHGERDWDRGGTMRGGEHPGMPGSEMPPGMRNRGMSSGSMGQGGSGSTGHRGGH